MRLLWTCGRGVLLGGRALADTRSGLSLEAVRTHVERGLTGTHAILDTAT